MMLEQGEKYNKREIYHVLLAWTTDGRTSQVVELRGI